MSGWLNAFNTLSLSTSNYLSTLPSIFHPLSTHSSIFHPSSTHPSIIYLSSTHPSIIHPSIHHPPIHHHPSSTHPSYRLNFILLTYWTKCLKLYGSRYIKLLLVLYKEQYGKEEVSGGISIEEFILSFFQVLFNGN